MARPQQRRAIGAGFLPDPVMSEGDCATSLAFGVPVVHHEHVAGRHSAQLAHKGRHR
jgi:hypothetical protein